MKKLLALFLAMVMVLSVAPFALAENETQTVQTNETVQVNETVIPEDVVAEAGVTPDSPVLWGLDRAIERISLALTLGKAAKAKKGLAYAKERLMEVQVMQQEKKADKAAKAAKDYEDLVNEAEENAAETGDGDAEQELEQQVEIEKKLDENKKIVEQIGNISLRMQGLTAEQQAQIKSMLQNMTQVTSDFKVKIQANKNKVKIKIKAEKGATDQEIKALEDALMQGTPLAKVRIVKQGTGVIKERGSDKNKTQEQVQEQEKESKGKKGQTESVNESEEPEDEVEEPEGNETEE